MTCLSIDDSGLSGTRQTSQRVDFAWADYTEDYTDATAEMGHSDLNIEDEKNG